MNNTTIGLDLAKNVFHSVELNQCGKQISRKKLARRQVKHFFVNKKPTHVAMEACSSAYYWAREISMMGHDVQLLPPQHVKAYLRGQKNDYNDAQAIAEARHHGAIRPVPLKTIEQQDEQAFHRIRQLRVKEQTKQSNQIRGLLAEYGLVLPQGTKQLKAALPQVLEDAENGLSMRFRELLHLEYQRLLAIETELTWFNEQLKTQSKEDEVCQRLMEIPGFGPVISSAMKSWFGGGKQYRRGRDASAALGVVPKQHSSGGKTCLLGITKRGDKYLRSLVVQGARSVVNHAGRKSDPLSLWINRLVKEKGSNKAVVALANKLIRIAWVIVARGERYQPQEVLMSV